MPSTETKHLTSLNFDLTEMQQQLASIPATVEQAAKNAQDAWNNNFKAGGGTGSGATGGGGKSGVETAVTATKAQLESLMLSYKNFEATLSRSNIYPASIQALREQAASAITQIEALSGELDSNGKLTGENAVKFQGLTSDLKASKGAFAELKTEANDTAGMMKKTGEATDQAGTGIRNFLGKLADKARWLAAFYLIQGIINGFKALVTTIKETETTVVELQRVLNENVSSEKISSELYAIAGEYGRTFAEVQESAVLFAQTGKSWDDVLTLTRGTMLALNTAELDVTQATEGLIAVMAQWDMGAEDYVGLIDKINKTADDYAITSEKIVAALQRSGGTAKAYGMTLEELIGVITALGEATGRTGENLGTAINSLITYTTKASSLDVLEEMGIQAKDAEGNLLPVLDIWSQLAQKIKGGDLAFADFMATDQAATDSFLSDSEEYQQAVADTIASGKEVQDAYSIAGTYRKNYFIALLNNLETAEEAVRGMSDAEGYSVTENEKYMATLAAASNQLTAAWQQLAVAFGDAGFLDFLKLLTDMGLGVAHLIENTGGLKVSLFALLGLLIMIKAQKIEEMLVGWGKAISSLFTKAKEGEKAISALQKGIGWLGIVTVAITALVAAFNALSKAGAEAREKLDGVAEASKSNYETLSGLVGEYNKLADAAGGVGLMKSQLDDARAIQDKIVALVGDQASGIDLVNGNLEEQLALLDSISEKHGQKTKQDLLDSKRAAQEEYDKGFDSMNSDSFIDQVAAAFKSFGRDASAVWKSVTKQINDSFELLGGGRPMEKLVTWYIGEDPETAVQTIDGLIDTLQRASTAAEATGKDLNNSVALAWLKSLKEAAEAAGTALQEATDTYYSFIARDSVGEYFSNLGETTQEMFDLYINTLSNPLVTLFNEDGSQMSQSVRDALINAARELFPEFSVAADDATALANAFEWGLRGIGESGNETAKTLEDVLSVMSDMRSEIGDAQSSLKSLTEVVDEYNETGIMSADMLLSLLDLEPEYIALLDFTASGISLNVDRTNELINSKNELVDATIGLKAAEWAAAIETNYAEGAYNAASDSVSAFSGELMNMINEAYGAGWSAETLANKLISVVGSANLTQSAALAMARDILTASQAMYNLGNASSYASSAMSTLSGWTGAKAGTSSGGGGGGGGGEDPQVKILEARKKAIEEEADAQIAALKKVQEAEDRKRKHEEYAADRSEALADVRRAQSRSGADAREDEFESEKKLAELDKDWQEQLQDWNLDDQIASIEAWKDAMVDAIDAQLDALKNAGGGGGGGGIADVFTNEADVLTQNKDALLAALLEMDNENLPEKIKAFYQLFDASQYTSDVDFSEQLAGIKTDWDTFTAENGDDWAIHYKMVLDDGTTMTPEQINDYINGLLGKATSESDLLKLDKEGLGILLRVTPDAETNKETEEQWSQTVNDLGQALTDVLDVLSSDDASFERVQAAIEDAFNEAFDAAEQAATDSGVVIEQQMAQAADDTGASMLAAVNGYSPQIVAAWNNNLINPMIAGLGDLSDTLDGVLGKLGNVAAFGGISGIGIGSTGSTSNTTNSQVNIVKLNGSGTTQVDPLRKWFL